MYTTHKHITTLFFKITSLIPNVWIHHSIRHFLECRDYFGYEITNTFIILNIHFAFDVSLQNIVHWFHVRRSRRSGEVAVLWTSSCNPSSWEIFVQPVTHICRPVWRCFILHEDMFNWILELIHCCPAVSRNYGGKTKEIIIIIIILELTKFTYESSL